MPCSCEQLLLLLHPCCCYAAQERQVNARILPSNSNCDCGVFIIKPGCHTIYNCIPATAAGTQNSIDADNADFDIKVCIISCVWA